MRGEGFIRFVSVGATAVRTRAGLLPKAPSLRLWGGKGEEDGLDNAKRFLHITPDALVLEVEGEDEVRSLDGESFAVPLAEQEAPIVHVVEMVHSQYMSNQHERCRVAPSVDSAAPYM